MPKPCYRPLPHTARTDLLRRREHKFAQGGKGTVYSRLVMSPCAPVWGEEPGKNNYVGQWQRGGGRHSAESERRAAGAPKACLDVGPPARSF